MTRPQRVWTRRAAWSVLLAVSAAALLWLAVVLNRHDKVASVATMAIGLAGLVIGLAGLALSIWQLQIARRHPSQPGVQADGQTVLDQAAERLATAVRLQWKAEAGLRGLRRPEPLRLAWTATRPVAAPNDTIVGDEAAGRVTRLRLRGDLDQVAEKFLALPQPRRVVVLGEAGAGKTVLAMLLTLALLDRDQPREPVPVLLGLSRWDPDAEHLHVWLARRLGEDYPALRSADFGPDAPQRLLAEGRVLPLLDGLDELPEAVRATAITELDRAHGDQPLVLTCRIQEFEQAVALGGALAAAAVVELEPVSAGQAAEFLLAAATPAVAARWDQVAEHLYANPEGELARALSTPLGVALARTVYASPARDPAELVKLAQDRDRAAVEDNLLEGFIPAAFAARPPAPGSLAPTRRWDPQAARRWLQVLAVHLDRQHTHDLAWWQLHRLLSARTVRLLVGLGIGLAGGLVGWLVGWLAGGLWVGLLVGLAAGLGGGLLGWLADVPQTGEAPAQVSTRIRGRLGLLTGLLAVLVTLMLAMERVSWLADGLAGVLARWLAVGLLSALVIALGVWLHQPVDTMLATTPRSVHRGDRTVTLVFGLVVGLVIGLMAAPSVGLGGGLAGGLVFGLVAGLATGPQDRMWVRFTIVRGWLALRGRLPWRLLAFLDDAHRLGVLRQAGAVYQFRHAMLQDHLVATQPGPE